jgi:bacterioferritin
VVDLKRNEQKREGPIAMIRRQQWAIVDLRQLPHHQRGVAGLSGLCVAELTPRTRRRNLWPPFYPATTMTSAAPSLETQTLRAQARHHIEQGAVTAGYTGDREKVIAKLNDALATEIVCVLRYRRHHFMARGIHGKTVGNEFLVHANEELGHADLLAERIIQLGGEPDLSPDSLSARSHAEYVAGSSLISMIKENLVAERIAIDSYRAFIADLGNDDPTTSELLKDILRVEEEHADELADLLDGLPVAA